jgi:hypothetical protein
MFRAFHSSSPLICSWSGHGMHGGKVQGTKRDGIENISSKSERKNSRQECTGVASNKMEGLLQGMYKSGKKYIFSFFLLGSFGTHVGGLTTKM